jgi:hypothetical protein
MRENDQIEIQIYDDNSIQKSALDLDLSDTSTYLKKEPSGMSYTSYHKE